MAALQRWLICDSGLPLYSPAMICHKIEIPSAKVIEGRDVEAISPRK